MALLVTAMVKPEMIQMVQNRLTGQTLYTRGPSADTLTSGRLTLQAGALQGWAESEPLQLIFGVGREGTKNNNLRLNGSHLIAHSAFVDELSAYGIVGFMSLMITLFMAYRTGLAKRPIGLSGWAGLPGGAMRLRQPAGHGLLVPEHAHRHAAGAGNTCCQHQTESNRKSLSTQGNSSHYLFGTFLQTNSLHRV